MATELDRLTVAGVEIDIIRETGLIPLKPVVESMGLTWAPQYQRVTQAHWATVMESITVDARGAHRPMLSVDGRTFVMWLSTIGTKAIKDPDVRSRVEAIQLEASQALYDYFTKGAAFNPRFPHAVEATEANEGYTLAQAARHLGFGLHSFTGALRAMDVIRKGPGTQHYPAPGFERWFDVATTNALRVTEEGMDALQQIAKDL